MIVIARVSLFYFAKYNDRAHSLVFVLLSVYRDIVILKLQTSSFFLPYIPVYSIPIGAWHVAYSLTLKDYNYLNNCTILIDFKLKKITCKCLSLLAV